MGNASAVPISLFWYNIKMHFTVKRILVRYRPIPIDRCGSEVMVVFNAGSPAFPPMLYTMPSSMYVLNDANMVGQVVAFPIVEDQVAGAGHIVHVLPLVALPEPFHIPDRFNFLGRVAYQLTKESEVNTSPLIFQACARHGRQLGGGSPLRTR